MAQFIEHDYFLGNANDLYLDEPAHPVRMEDDADGSFLLLSTQPSAAPTSQAPPAGGLFGASTTNTAQPQQSTSLFGNTAQPQQSGGLFGNTNTNTNQTSGGLFGNANTTAQTQNRGLFGNAATPAQPQQTGGLFGNAPTNTASTSLFGGFGQSQQQQPAQQQQAGSSLFGNTNTAARPAGGLFGSTSTAQPQQSSLFGGASNTATAGTSLFGGQPNVNQPNPTNSIFGLSASQPPSLLNASQYRNSQYAPFAGKLTMGQPTQAPAAQGAVKINFDTMRTTTRFGDCIEDIQKQLEAVDSMIQAQERFCREIEAFLPKHGVDVKSVSPDVDLIKDHADAVETALSVDAQSVASRRTTLDQDIKDFQRCQRVADNLRMPAQFHVPSVAYGSVTSPINDDATYDMNLIGNFFTPRAADFQATLTAYATNLTEIEAHLRVIESSAVGQAQQLAARRAGMSNGVSSNSSADDNVRDLADTLRAFEGSILGAASLVGECREGVNGLVLGRLAGGNGASSSERPRRPW